jgi:two-component system NtrC family sensor kinase
MFQSIKKAVWWFSGYLLIIVITIFFNEQILDFAETVPPGELIVRNSLLLIGLSVTVFLSMLYFVYAFQREYARAENLVDDLTRSNSELMATLKRLEATQGELVQSEKMASLGKLAAGVAHEINNPLGALRSTAGTSAKCLDRMERFMEKNQDAAGLKTNTEFQGFLEILKDSSLVFAGVSERVADTVKRFLDFARLDKASVDTIDLHQSIDNMLMLIQKEIKDKVTIQRDYGDLPKIACHPLELNQVFMNLLTNAAHAIEGKGCITIQTFMDKENVQVRITDTGSGIPEDRIKDLFDPGFTEDRSRVKASLGLFTSYQIIQKHRGQIRVESEVGVGSTFTVILPVK